MLTHVRKIGNSAGTIIPAPLMKKLQLQEGDMVSIAEQDGNIIISPVKSRPKYQLADLLAQCDPTAPMPESLQEWDQATAVGNEI
ncbi:AbrB/MazE/SpoVT family DNA-binding domain-containing protein [Rheinheimera riviphila]|uniref:AbrB/MazE/SpoVT family DNA-binding domain-containing protein n=1 Tax=Rheinheimera riviphila TaxID=1834037 RepID=A0A437QBV1_9GAMM|nr:AbrB/MazE/SpoVT family DNA-binding domain-containing protein [Rheinheimera riviphila]